MDRGLSAEVADPVLEVSPPTIEPTPDGYRMRVEIGVQFWEGTTDLLFDRAECWTQVGGVKDTLEHGVCNFSVVATVRHTPEPGGMLAAGLVLLVLLAHRRRWLPGG